MALDALKLGVYRVLPPRLRVLAARYSTPNFTVGCIGLITRDGTQLLLVRPSYRDGWMPPGGHLERGENPVEALTREIVEELGVAMTFEPPHRVAFDVGRLGVTFVSLGVAPDAAEFVVSSDELIEVGWFALDDLPQLSNDFTEGLPDEDLAAVRGVATTGRT
jgi:8-oxo-dGTP diphosphatase